MKKDDLQKLVRRLWLALPVFYGLMLGGLYLFQDAFVYNFNPTRRMPSEFTLSGLDRIQETELVTTDNVKLVLWVAEPEEGKPVILYFHGNSGNLGGRRYVFAALVEAGYGLAAMGYRGASGSGGQPGEERLVSDALELYDALPALIPGASGPPVIMGVSMGSGVATRLAVQRRTAALILSAPFTSMVDAVRANMGVIGHLTPVRFLLRDQYRSIDIIDQVAAPLLIMHSKSDEVIPYRQAEALFARANEPKYFFSSQQAHHNNLWDLGGREAILQFLAAKL